MSTATYTAEIAHAISLTGKTVTVGTAQYYVHSIEGHDWYTFRDENGSITIDINLTPSRWITTPIATLIPSGHKFGDGHSEMRPIASIKRGVCLEKSYR